MRDIARRAASGESFEGVEGGDAGFLVMLYEIIRDRPDVHKGWLEAELDAQLFVADLNNANEVAKMADDQTEGIGRARSLWFVALWPKSAGDRWRPGQGDLWTLSFNDKVQGL